MAGAHEADGANRVCFEMLAEALVEGKERRLHGFHEETIVLVGGGEDFFELGDVEGGGFFAEDVLAGGEGLDAEIGVLHSAGDENPRGDGRAGASDRDAIREPAKPRLGLPARITDRVWTMVVAGWTGALAATEVEHRAHPL